MRIDIITCCPELLESPLNHSIIQRAKDKGLCEIYVHNLRDWTLDKHRKVDDYAFGFGAGMVLQIEPIDRCISHLTSERHYDEIIFTAPDGERLTRKQRMNCRSKRISSSSAGIIRVSTNACAIILLRASTVSAISCSPEVRCRQP